MYLYTSLENARDYYLELVHFEARLLLREVFASNRSAPTITGMITRPPRCCCSMDIKVFMFENIIIIIKIIIISVVRRNIKDK